VNPVASKRFSAALCAVGGARGGRVVPDCFGMLPALGVDQVYLFWAMPSGPEGLVELDVLRSDAELWLSELRALGVGSELVIKRGSPGPWIAALAGICGADLVVCGPPSVRGGTSETIDHLLRALQVPLLVLPEDGCDGDLFARPLVDTERSPEAEALIAGWLGCPASRHDLAVPSAPGPDAARTALALAQEAAASVLVLSGSSDVLVPHAVRDLHLPLLILPQRLREGGLAPAG
jgi:hypothetical protein